MHFLYKQYSMNNSPCTPKALSPGVERQILGVKLAHVLFIIVTCTLQATRRGVQDTQRSSL